VLPPVDVWIMRSVALVVFDNYFCRKIAYLEKVTEKVFLINQEIPDPSNNKPSMASTIRMLMKC